MELDCTRADDEAERAAFLKTQRGGRTGGKNDIVRRQELEAILGGERGLQYRAAQDVETNDAQRLFGAGHADVELERRAYEPHAREPRDARIERLGKA